MTALRNIGSIARTAYLDLAALVRQMWPVLLAIAALYVAAVMAYFSVSLLVGTGLGRVVMRMLVFIGCAAVTAPCFVALHRFVAFREVRWLPPADAYRHARVYIGWIGLSVAMWFAPLIAAIALDGAGLTALGGLLGLGGLLAVWSLMVRLTTLWPMAALEPGRASLSRALEQSRGHFWMIFAATNGPASPAFFALILIGRAAAQHAIGALPFWLLAMSAMLSLQIVLLAVGTRLYQRFSAASALAQGRQPSV